MKIRAVRGMNDILPAESARWQALEARFRDCAASYGYAEVRTPLIEHTPLFRGEIGETTDVVEKEMYSFVRHDDELTVRPEGTAGVARAYVEHGIAGRQPMSRWYYLGPMFRGERPAKGRYRQFFQAGCELFGDAGPVGDAELIELCHAFLKSVGIRDVVVHINSLGSGDTRERYREALRAHFTPIASELSDDSQRRLEKNPLRILDSKHPKDQAAKEGAPKLLDVLSDDDRAHFDGVLDQLKALEVPFVVDHQLVRGLDYYTRTLFELRTEMGDLGAQNTLGGGGRYDGMVHRLGGQDVPAIGFALGLERILAASELPAADVAPEVLVAVLDPEARAAAQIAAKQFRSEGLRVDLDGRLVRLKAMFKRADAVGARFCAILGGDEAQSGKVSVKDLLEKTQEQLPVGEAASWMKQRLVKGERGSS